MQINRKTIGASSAVRLFAGDIWLNSVALGSSSHTIRTSENLRELFNRFEIDKKQTFKNSGGIPDSGFSSHASQSVSHAMPCKREKLKIKLKKNCMNKIYRTALYRTTYS